MEIKKTLDNIPRLVFWRIDEATILIIPFSLGILFGSFLLMAFGFIASYFYRRIRKRNRNTNCKAFLYWWLGVGYTRIPSYLRRLRP